MLNLDSFIIEFDKGLRTLFSQARSTRVHPGIDLSERDLSEAEKRHSVALMRVNHCGEICAQALYQGQALTARDPELKLKMNEAAKEETEHLAWTAHRVHELGGHLSVLNPVWYASSLTIGVVAGVFGDKWSLGFLAETERQVGAHLQTHLVKLPEQDLKSRAVVQQMYIDETSHAEMAQALGAAELPLPVKLAMQLSSTLMTRTAYWV